VTDDRLLGIALNLVLFGLFAVLLLLGAGSYAFLHGML